ncbi:MAG: hypothetical protein F4110_09010 [Acidimicrobiaceae bacterium]|nr:hypothetical protein [Acidimicrobiaceae bacterium]MYI54101.1 hypothetical protein [Acidimicrobiaceae bacterium]MYJ82376.1 hypothetical protein [Acidimicrobiaceae bacterium]
MALTHTQRTSMFNTLTEVMGQDDAETLMQHLPPSGWDNVATKEDLRAGFAETNAAIATGLAQATTERADIIKTVSEGLAQAATERADIIKTVSEGLAQAATERADIIRRQAWHLYIVVTTVVSTVAVASVSIWIALLTRSVG